MSTDATPKATAHVLLVEDDESILDMLAGALGFAGYTVTTAMSGAGALNVCATGLRPDLVVLDVNLPDVDGFEVCRRLRAGGDKVPVIFLTARREREDLREGFSGGGDDYLTKPFSLEELRFRIEAVLRRAGTTATAVASDEGKLQCGDLVLDQDTRYVFKGDVEVTLTRTEFELLRYLMANVGRVITRAQIIERVRSYDYEGDSRVVESYVSGLRRKVDFADPPLIHTVRGVGYSIRPPRA